MTVADGPGRERIVWIRVQESLVGGWDWSSAPVQADLRGGEIIRRQKVERYNWIPQCNVDLGILGSKKGQKKGETMGQVEKHAQQRMHQATYEIIEIRSKTKVRRTIRINRTARPGWPSGC